MKHRTEQILAAIYDLLINRIDGVGPNVRRSDPRPLTPDEIPCITIEQGEEEITTQTHSHYDVSLNVKIVHTLFRTDYSISETTLNSIRAQVSVLLLTDNTLGLSGIVHDIDEIGTEEPEESSAGEFSTLEAVQTFNVRYRRNRLDPR